MISTCSLLYLSIPFSLSAQPAISRRVPPYEPGSAQELSQQQPLWKEEEDNYQHQDRSDSLDQEDSKPPQIKEDQEESCCYQDEEPLTVKQEMDTSMVTMHEQDDDSELGLNPDQSQEKPEVNTTVQSPVLPDPACDLQLLSYSPHISESKDEENRTSEDSRWTTAEEPKQTMKQNHPKCQTGIVNSPAESAVDCDTDTELSQQQPLWKEEEDDNQHQDRSCSLDQEDSKPPQIKEDQEESCCYQDGESLTVKQEMDTLMVTMHEQDPDCDLQLLSYSPHISESKDEENSTSEDSRWTTAEEP
ncbi:hypothetical protein D4764_0227730, partial [Takifugu flavidus]